MKLQPPLDRRYRILAPLGAGGQASVHHATDLERNLDVALKVLHMNASASSKRRLEREAGALASLRHPHLARLYEMHLDHVPPFLSTEFVDGRALIDHIATQGEQPLEEVRTMGRAVAAALAYMHAKGIIHRDVKPGNILMSPSRGPVLVDLGLVHGDFETRLTRTGAAVGTPVYLPPEAFATRPASEALDIFSLGVTLYHAITGRLPFDMTELAQAATGAPLSAEPARLLERELGPVAAAALSPLPEERPTASNLEIALGRAPDATVDDLLPAPGGSHPVASAPEPARPASARHPADQPSPATPASAAHRSPWLFLGLLALGILAALVPNEPPAPVPSLILRPGPFDLTIEWQGSEGGDDLELCAGDTSLLSLRGDPGPRSATLPLEESRTFRVLRGGVSVPFGVNAVREIRMAPAGLPPREGVLLALGPDGLEVQISVDKSAWIPDRLRLANGDRAWTIEGLSSKGGGRRYPLGRPISGDQPLEISALSRTEGGEFLTVGDGPWLRRELRPRGVSVARREVFRGEGPYLPVASKVRAVELAPPASRDNSNGGPFAMRTVNIHIPGLVPGRFDGRDLLWAPAMTIPGQHLVGFLPEVGTASVDCPLPPGSIFGRDYGVVALAEGIGFRWADNLREQQAGRRWISIQPGGRSHIEDLTEDGFQPTVGPFPTGDGRAFFLGPRLRLRSTDRRGYLRKTVGEPLEDIFVPRRGGQQSDARRLALAGTWDRANGMRSPCLVILDRRGPRLLGSVEGLTEVPPSHPLVLEEGSSEGIWFSQGRSLYQIDLKSFPLDREGPPTRTTLERLLRGGQLRELPLARAPDTKAVADKPRALPTSDGTVGILPFFDDAKDPPTRGEITVRGSPITWHRWRVRLLGPGLDATLDLDDGPFRVFGKGFHHAGGDLDTGRGLAGILVDGSRERWSVNLLSLAPPRVLVRWALHPTISVQVPALSDEGLLLPLWPDRMAIFPYPMGPLEAIDP